MNTKLCMLLAGSIGLSILGFMGVRAWNARITPEKIAAGKALFEHEWSVNDSLCGDGDGLGPVFNAQSCVACHFQGGVGGSSGNEFNVTGFEIDFDEDEDVAVESGIIHAKAIDDKLLETRELVRQRHPSFQQETQFETGCGTYTRTETIDPLVIQVLNSPPLFGVGLIDEMSDLSISFEGNRRLANRIVKEINGDFSGNRVGMPRMVRNRIGKFGWKGQFASLEEFVASACAMEIGLTNPLHSQVVPQAFQADEEAKQDMTRKQLHELVCFVKSLPRPEQVLPLDEEARKDVIHGEEVFNKVGCAECHPKEIGGIVGIYSDFHLYNLERPDQAQGSYSDGGFEQEFDFNRKHPHPDQWQTPPLWGVADSAPYFHDGKSLTLDAAIRRHHGQARSSLEKYDDLRKSEQQQLVKFLKSLRAPQVASAMETAAK